MFATLVDIDVAIRSAFFALHYDTSGIFNVLLYCTVVEKNTLSWKATFLLNFIEKSY